MPDKLSPRRLDFIEQGVSAGIARAEFYGVKPDIELLYCRELLNYIHLLEQERPTQSQQPDWNPEP